MKKKICLFILLMFICIRVNATDDITTFNLTEFNSVDSSSIITSNTGKCSAQSEPSILKDNRNFNVNISDSPDGTDIPCDVSYDVILMVDATKSMNDNSKISQANKAIKRVINELKKNEDNKLIVTKFNSKVDDLGDFKKIGDFKVDDYTNYLYNVEGKTNLGGQTNLQLALKESYDKFENQSYGTNDRQPILILITDGYPTAGYESYDVTKKVLSNPIKGTSGGAEFAYYTARTFDSFKKNFKGKLIAVGVGIDTDDAYANFILNPNDTTYANLKNDTRSTESRVLYNAMANDTGTFYDSVFRMNGYPELGVFSATSVSGTTATFKLTKTECENYNKRIENSNKLDNPYAFQFYPSRPNGDAYLVYPSNGLSWKVKGKNQLVCSSNGTNVEYKFDKDIQTLDNINYKNGWWSNSSDGDVIKISSSFGDDVINFITDNLNTNDSCDDSHHDGYGPTNTRSVNSTRYTSNSKDYSININVNDTFGRSVLYYKIPDSFGPDNENNNLDGFKFYDRIDEIESDGNKGKSCVPVTDVSIPIIITEKSSINLNISDVKYAGSGFTLSGDVNNVIEWDYLAKTKSGGALNILFPKNVSGYYIVSHKDDNTNYYVVDNDRQALKYTHLNYVDANDLFIDSDCSVNTGISSRLSSYVTASVNELITNRIYSKDVIKSVNSNEYDANKSYDKQINSFVNTNIVSSINNSSVNLKLNIGTACIVLNDETVDGVEYSNGDIRYDKNGEGCNNNETPGINESGSYLHYVPINYNSDIVVVKMDEVDFSSIDGISINYNLLCSSTVGKKEMKYVYRSIDVSNPFPKGVIPSNWSDWWKSPGNSGRMYNSYNDSNLIYSISVGREKSLSYGSSLGDIREYNRNRIYTDWDGMKSNGESSFVVGDKNIKKFNFYVKNTNSYCPIGQFNSGCDNH